MKSLKMLAVILLAGIVVASALMSSAQAGPGKLKITLTCTASGMATIDNTGGTVTTVGPCTSNIATFTAPADIDVKIIGMAGAANAVTVTITDAAGDQKYNVMGGASDTDVSHNDDTGDDKLDFKGDGGTNSLTVNDAAGGGNDKYDAKDTSFIAMDGGGNDMYEGKAISTFTFTDAPGDKDKINVKTT